MAECIQVLCNGSKTEIEEIYFGGNGNRPLSFLVVNVCAR